MSENDPRCPSNVEPMLHDSGFVHNPVERVVAIEYHRGGPNGSWIPFSVFTVNHKKPPTDGRIFGLYDFEWSLALETLYYHLSGAGGRFYVHRLADPKAPPSCAIWWDANIVSPTNGGSKSKKPISAKTISGWGYEILQVPIPILGGGPNPFALAEEDDVLYCSKCDDWLPQSWPCEHIVWCDACEWYSTPSEPCNHKRQDGKTPEEEGAI